MSNSIFFENEQSIKTRKLELDPSVHNQILDLTSRHKEFPNSCFGLNEDGEDVRLDINKESLTITTYQTNRWIRQTTYYRDGTVEEVYDSERW